MWPVRMLYVRDTVLHCVPTKMARVGISEGSLHLTVISRIQRLLRRHQRNEPAIPTLSIENTATVSNRATKLSRMTDEIIIILR
jgi:hypothetical protein